MTFEEKEREKLEKLKKNGLIKDFSISVVSNNELNIQIIPVKGAGYIRAII